MPGSSFRLPKEIEQISVDLLVSSGMTPHKLAVASRAELLSLQRELLMGSVWGTWEVAPELMAVCAVTSSNRTYRVERAIPEGEDSQGTWACKIWSELIRVSIAFRLWPGKLGYRLAYSSILSILRSLGLITRGMTPHDRPDFWQALSADEILSRVGSQQGAKRLSDLRFLLERGAILDNPRSRRSLSDARPVRSRVDEPEHIQDVHTARQFQPLPDSLIGAGGHRAIWFMENIGPTLLEAMEACHELSIRRSNADPRHSNYGRMLLPDRAHQIEAEAKNRLISNWDWRDKNGQSVRSLPFSVHFSSKPIGSFEWPPKFWSQATALLGVLQSSHLWIPAFAMGSRHREILSLREGCLRREDSVAPTCLFRTSKMDGVGGTGKEVPIPTAVQFAVRQQERLARYSKSTGAVDGDHLWVSTSNFAGTALTNANYYLRLFVRTFELNALLDGSSIHMHRFRKSLARICALALVHAPKVLMDVFGHRDEQMTVLRYILSDHNLLSDVQETVRELIVLKGVDAVERVDQLQGAAAGRLRERIQQHAKRLGSKALEPKNLMEFVRAMTEDGGGWAVVGPGIVCTNFTRGGLCNRGHGAANPDYCHPKCDNQLVFPDYEQDGSSVASAVTNAIRSIDFMLERLQEADAVGESMLVAQFQGQIKALLGRWEQVDMHFKTHPTLNRYIPLVLAESANE